MGMLVNQNGIGLEQLNKKIIKMKLLIVIFVMGLLPVTSYADLPLTVEDLLTAERRWRVDLNLTYSNSDQENVDSRYGVIPVGENQFVSIPLSVSSARQNMDILATTAGIRYGLTLDTELYGRLTGIAEYSRRISVDGSTRNTNTRPSDFWFGVNHRFSKDNKTPALLGFFELALAENVDRKDQEFVFAKSTLVGLTTYRAIDPLVLSLSMGYSYSRTRDVGSNTENPGDFLFINPSVGFAVNNLVTLTTGGRWQARQRDEFNGKAWGIRTTSTNMEFSLGYAWSKKTTVQVSSRFNVSGRPNASTTLNIIYKLSQKHL